MGKFITVVMADESKMSFAFIDDKISTVTPILNNLASQGRLLSYAFSETLEGKTYYSYDKFLRWLSKVCFDL